MASLSLRVRSALLVALCSLLLYTFCISAPSILAQGDDASLKSLYDGHRWFELRDFVGEGGASAFYQGAVACAFNDLRRCDKKLRAVFNSAPQSDEAVDAHRILASAYFTHGKYKKALAQVDAILTLRPHDSDASSGRPVIAVLAESPDQEFAGGRTTVELRDGGLPFSINGVEATYWFDTGAELSVLSESEAKRFGLRIQSAAVKVGDLNGTQVSARITVADELSIGSGRLRQVAFLVLPDNQPPFDEQSPGARGLIGLPVLLALERFAWGADKKFEIGPKPSNKSVPHADLCFDGNHPVVQVRYDNRALAFALDTGASNTDLYPPFAAAFPELIRSAAKTDSYKMEGVGGAKYMEAATLESLKFSIGGFPVTLKSAGVLLKPTTDSSKFFAGNLGIDLLQQAHKTTFDFKAMSLILQ
jgi:predicted aspartyl protease